MNHSEEYAIAAVDNLVRESRYYKGVVQEQAEIIKQLTEGPGDVEYIHPLDLCELLNSSRFDYVDIWKHKDGEFNLSCSVGLPSDSFPHIGKRYKQSIHIPPRTKAVK